MSDNGNIGTLVRSKLWFDDGFAQVPNAWIRDKRLTYTARGVLIWMLSHDAGYEITIRGMAAGTMHGVAALRTAVGELERAGYLKRYRRRDRGRIVGTNWHLFDPFTPASHAAQLDLGLEPVEMKNPSSEPESTQPDVAQPDVAQPDVDDRTTKEDQLLEDLTQVSREPATDAGANEVVPECHHEKIPGDGRCLFACAADNERQRRLRASA